MSFTGLNIHDLVKDLKAAGFNDDQAEAVTRAVKLAGHRSLEPRDKGRFGQPADQG